MQSTDADDDDDNDNDDYNVPNDHCKEMSVLIKCES